MKRKILTIMLHSDTILLRVSEDTWLFYAEQCCYFHST